MPPPRKVDLLPNEDRAWLDGEIVRRGFADYEGLATLLAERGYEISRAVLGQHGLALKRKLAAIRTSTEAAQLIASAAPDSADHRSEAVMSLVQNDLFEVLVNLQEADEETDAFERLGMLSKAAKAIAELSRASVNQKKWAEEVKTKAESAAQAVEKIAHKSGLSADAANEIRREILGIAA